MCRICLQSGVSFSSVASDQRPFTFNQVLFDSPSRQAVPVELYTSNLRELLTILPADTPQLLITPPLIQPARWAADRELEKEDRSEENTARFAQAARDVAAQLKKEGHNVVLVDIWEVSRRPISASKAAGPAQLKRPLQEGDRLTILTLTLSFLFPLRFRDQAMVAYRSNPANDVSSLLIDGLHLSASVRPPPHLISPSRAH